MVDLTTERPFWMVKAEYPSFAAFLRDVSAREDHARASGSRCQTITSYRAGEARVRLLEERGSMINIFRDIRTLTDCVGTPLVWGNGEELAAMKARYGGVWTDAVDSCYLDDKYAGLAWEPHWLNEATGWEQAWRYVWETAALDQAMVAAWARTPTQNLVEGYERVWADWWASLPALETGSGEADAEPKIVALQG